MDELECIGADGERRIFFVEGPLTRVSGEWSFHVHARNPPGPNDDWFEARFRPAGDGTAQSVMMSHNYKAQYKRMGIPEEVILFASAVLNMKVVSSPVVATRQGEFVVDPARKVWERLVARGMAVFVPESNRYELL